MSYTDGMDPEEESQKELSKDQKNQMDAEEQLSSKGTSKEPAPSKDPLANVNFEPLPGTSSESGTGEQTYSIDPGRINADFSKQRELLGDRNIYPFSDLDEQASQAQGSLTKLGVGAQGYAAKTFIRTGKGIVDMAVGASYLGAKAKNFITNSDENVNPNEFFDNALSQSFAQADQEVEEDIMSKIFTSNKYDEGGVLQKMGTPEFWAKDVGDGLSFATAFLASSYVTMGAAGIAGAGLKTAGAATGASKALSAAGKLAGQPLRALGKTAVANGMKGNGFLKAAFAQSPSVYSSAAMNTISESFFEAQALSNELKESIPITLYGKHYEDLSPEEKEDVDQRRGQAASGTFNGNMWALLGPNLLTSKIFFGGGASQAKKMFLGKIDGADVNKMYRKWPKIGKDLGASIISEGLWEENIQSAMEQYYSDKALNKTSENYNGIFRNMSNNVSALYQSVTNPDGDITARDTQGAMSIVLGSMIGAMMGGPGSFIKHTAEKKNIEKTALRINSLYERLQKADSELAGNYQGIYQQYDTTIPSEDGGSEKTIKSIINPETGFPQVDPNKLRNLMTQEFKNINGMNEAFSAAMRGDEAAFNTISNDLLTRFAFQEFGRVQTLEPGSYESTDEAADFLKTYLQHQSDIVASEMDEKSAEIINKQRNTFSGKINELASIHEESRANAMASVKDLMSNLSAEEREDPANRYSHMLALSNLMKAEYLAKARLLNLRELEGIVSSKKAKLQISKLIEQQEAELQDFSDSKQISEMLSVYKTMYQVTSGQEIDSLKDIEDVEEREFLKDELLKVLGKSISNPFIRNVNEYSKRLQNMTQGQIGYHNMGTFLQAEDIMIGMEIEDHIRLNDQQSAKNISEALDRMISPSDKLLREAKEFFERKLEEEVNTQAQIEELDFAYANAYNEAENAETEQILSPEEIKALFDKAEQINNQGNALGKPTPDLTKGYLAKLVSFPEKTKLQSIEEILYQNEGNAKQLDKYSMLYQVYNLTGAAMRFKIDEIVPEDIQSIQTIEQKLKGARKIYSGKRKNLLAEAEFENILEDIDEALAHLKEMRKAANKAKADRSAAQVRADMASRKMAMLGIGVIADPSDGTSNFSFPIDSEISNLIGSVVKEYSAMLDSASKNEEQRFSEVYAEIILEKFREKAPEATMKKLQELINNKLKENGQRIEGFQTTTKKTKGHLEKYIANPGYMFEQLFNAAVSPQSTYAYLKSNGKIIKPFYNFYKTKNIVQFQADVKASTDPFIEKNREKIELMIELQIESVSLKNTQIMLESTYESEQFYGSESTLQKKVNKQTKLENAAKKADKIPITPTREQDRAIKEIAKLLGAKFVKQLSLLGVAGSGKTTMINRALAAANIDKSAIATVSYNEAASKNIAQQFGKIANASDPTAALDITDILNLTKENGVKVIIVDEAPNIYNESIAEILATAENIGAKVLFIGDPSQLTRGSENNSFSSNYSSGGINVIDITSQRTNKEFNPSQLYVAMPLTQVYRSDIAAIRQASQAFQDNMDMVEKTSTNYIHEKDKSYGVRTGITEKDLISSLRENKGNGRQKVIVASNVNAATKQYSAIIDEIRASGDNIEVRDVYDVQGSTIEEVYIDAEDTLNTLITIMNQQENYAQYNRGMFTLITRGKDFVFIKSPHNWTSFTDDTVRQSSAQGVEELSKNHKRFMDKLDFVNNTLEDTNPEYRKTKRKQDEQDSQEVEDAKTTEDTPITPDPIDPINDSEENIVDPEDDIDYVDNPENQSTEEVSYDPSLPKETTVSSNPAGEIYSLLHPNNNAVKGKTPVISVDAQVVIGPVLDKNGKVQIGVFAEKPNGQYALLSMLDKAEGERMIIPGSTETVAQRFEKAKGNYPLLTDVKITSDNELDINIQYPDNAYMKASVFAAKPLSFAYAGPRERTHSGKGLFNYISEKVMDVFAGRPNFGKVTMKLIIPSKQNATALGVELLQPGETGKTGVFAGAPYIMIERANKGRALNRQFISLQPRAMNETDADATSIIQFVNAIQNLQNVGIPYQSVMFTNLVSTLKDQYTVDGTTATSNISLKNTLKNIHHVTDIQKGVITQAWPVIQEFSDTLVLGTYSVGKTNRTKVYYAESAGIEAAAFKAMQDLLAEVRPSHQFSTANIVRNENPATKKNGSQETVFYYNIPKTESFAFRVNGDERITLDCFHPNFQGDIKSTDTIDFENANRLNVPRLSTKVPGIAQAALNRIAAANPKYKVDGNKTKNLQMDRKRMVNGKRTSVASAKSLVRLENEDHAVDAIYSPGITVRGRGVIKTLEYRFKKMTGRYATYPKSMKYSEIIKMFAGKGNPNTTPDIYKDPTTGVRHKKVISIDDIKRIENEFESNFMTLQELENMDLNELRLPIDRTKLYQKFGGQNNLPEGFDIDELSDEAREELEEMLTTQLKSITPNMISITTGISDPTPPPTSTQSTDKKADVDTKSEKQIEADKKVELDKEVNAVKNAKTKEELIKYSEQLIGINPYDAGAVSMGTRAALMTPGSFEKGKQLFLEEIKGSIKAKYDAELKALKQPSESEINDAADEFGDSMDFTLPENVSEEELAGFLGELVTTKQLEEELERVGIGKRHLQLVQRLYSDRSENKSVLGKYKNGNVLIKQENPSDKVRRNVLRHEIMHRIYLKHLNSSERKEVLRAYERETGMKVGEDIDQVGFEEHLSRMYQVYRGDNEAFKENWLQRFFRYVSVLLNLSDRKFADLNELFGKIDAGVFSQVRTVEPSGLSRDYTNIRRIFKDVSGEPLTRYDEAVSYLLFYINNAYNSENAMSIQESIEFIRRALTRKVANLAEAAKNNPNIEIQDEYRMKLAMLQNYDDLISDIIPVSKNDTGRFDMLSNESFSELTNLLDSKMDISENEDVLLAKEYIEDSDKIDQETKSPAIVKAFLSTIPYFASTKPGENKFVNFRFGYARLLMSMIGTRLAAGDSVSQIREQMNNKGSSEKSDALLNAVANLHESASRQAINGNQNVAGYRFRKQIGFANNDTFYLWPNEAALEYKKALGEHTLEYLENNESADNKPIVIKREQNEWTRAFTKRIEAALKEKEIDVSNDALNTMFKVRRDMEMFNTLVSTLGSQTEKNSVSLKKTSNFKNYTISYNYQKNAVQHHNYAKGNDIKLAIQEFVEENSLNTLLSRAKAVQRKGDPVDILKKILGNILNIPFTNVIKPNESGAKEALEDLNYLIKALDTEVVVTPEGSNIKDVLDDQKSRLNTIAANLNANSDTLRTGTYITADGPRYKYILGATVSKLLDMLKFIQTNEFYVNKRSGGKVKSKMPNYLTTAYMQKNIFMGKNALNHIYDYVEHEETVDTRIGALLSRKRTEFKHEDLRNYLERVFVGGFLDRIQRSTTADVRYFQSLPPISDKTRTVSVEVNAFAMGKQMDAALEEIGMQVIQRGDYIGKLRGTKDFKIDNFTDLKAFSFLTKEDIEKLYNKSESEQRAAVKEMLPRVKDYLNEEARLYAKLMLEDSNANFMTNLHKFDKVAGLIEEDFDFKNLLTQRTDDSGVTTNKVETKQLTVEKILPLTRLFIYNDYVNSHQLAEIVAGPRMFYKNGSSSLKRFAGGWSSGTFLAIDSEGNGAGAAPTFTAAAVSDQLRLISDENKSKLLNDFSPEKIDELFELMLDDQMEILRNEAKDFYKVGVDSDITTKQFNDFKNSVYMTKTGEKTITEMLRDIGLSEESIFEVQPAYGEDYFNPTDAQAFITPQRLDDIIAGTGTHFNSRAILKGSYYGMTVRDGVTVIDMLKYSQVVLSDELVNKPGHKGLKNMRENMIRASVDETVFESAIKLGYPLRKVDPYKLVNTVSDNVFYDNADDVETSSIMELNNENFKLNHNPIKSADSQVRLPSQFTFMSSFSAEDASIAESMYSALSKIFKIREKDIDRLTDTKLSKLSTEILQRFKRGNDAKVFEMVTQAGLSLNFPAFRKKTLYQIASIFEAKSVGFRFPGTKLVMESHYGKKYSIDGVERELEMREDPKTKMLYVETIVPRGLLSKEEEALIESGKTGEVYMNGDAFGFRIPSSHLHSGVVMRVVGFYDARGTNMIVVPAALNIIQGSDFDVDAIFTIRRERFSANQDVLRDAEVFEKTRKALTKGISREQYDALNTKETEQYENIKEVLIATQRLARNYTKAKAISKTQKEPVIKQLVLESKFENYLRSQNEKDSPQARLKFSMILSDVIYDSTTNQWKPITTRNEIYAEGLKAFENVETGENEDLNAYYDEQHKNLKELSASYEVLYAKGEVVGYTRNGDGKKIIISEDEFEQQLINGFKVKSLEELYNIPDAVKILEGYYKNVMIENYLELVGKKANRELFARPIFMDRAKDAAKIINTARKGMSNKITAINESDITYTDEEGNPCAKMGLTNATKGTGWKIVKDFKGQPKHSQGGVDISISDKGVSMRRGGKDIKAAHGLVIPATIMAQEGLVVEGGDDDKTDDDKTEMKKSYDFTKEYYNSPKFEKRYKKAYYDAYGSFSNIRGTEQERYFTDLIAKEDKMINNSFKEDYSKIKTNLESGSYFLLQGDKSQSLYDQLIRKYKNRPTPTKEGIGSHFETDTNTTFVYNKQTDKENKQLPVSKIAPHEFSHQAINKVATIPLKQKEEIESMQKSNVKSHLKDVYETKADIDAFRYFLHKNNIYNPMTEDFTKEHLEKYKKIDIENYKRLKELYEEDNVIKLMNIIASNNTKTDTNNS